MKYLYGAYEKGHAMATYAYACERMQFTGIIIALAVKMSLLSYLLRQKEKV